MSIVNKLGGVWRGHHTCPEMPIFVWQVCDNLLSEGVMSIDVYDVAHMFYVLIVWGGGSDLILCYDVLLGPIVAPVSRDEISLIPDMPANWDIPF